MAIKKFYVVVDDVGTTRWYKDAKCTVLHRENAPLSNGQTVPKAGIKMAYCTALTAQPLNSQMGPSYGIRMAICIAQMALPLNIPTALSVGTSMATL